MSELSLRIATADDAPEWLHVIRKAFAARRPVDPPAEALSDTLETITRDLTAGYGIGAMIGHTLAGCLILDVSGSHVTLRRVSVLPEYAGRKIADALVTAALDVAADVGAHTASLVAREEFPELVQWWQRRGFIETGRSAHVVHLQRQVPLLLDVPNATAMRRLGEQIGRQLRPGDLIIAAGELGAGKTTLAQGVGAGMDVEGPIISPTFVLERQHRSRHGGPNLVHVDAYRLASAAELADIDLESLLEHSVVLVEWGTGIAEWLNPERLELRIEREPASDTRTVVVNAIGARWSELIGQLEA